MITITIPEAVSIVLGVALAFNVAHNLYSVYWIRQQIKTAKALEEAGERLKAKLQAQALHEMSGGPQCGLH